jgi:hypothetical protein
MLRRALLPPSSGLQLRVVMRLDIIVSEVFAAFVFRVTSP